MSTNLRFGGSFNTAWQAQLHAGGKYLDLYEPDDTWARSFPPNASADVDHDVPHIVARQMFYNNSEFHGNNAGTSADDDAAIAFDKVALLPGYQATFSNYTSYSRGLNGLMIDMAALSAAPTVDGFRFRVGNNSGVDGRIAAPVPLAIEVRPGAGYGGSDRVTMIWPDGSITNQWLQVTVLPTGTANLPGSDVFYFGNAIAETGDSDYNARVNATDEVAVRNTPSTFLAPATIDSVFDINRDTFVNAINQILVRSHITMLRNALVLIAPPGCQRAGNQHLRRALGFFFR